MPLHFEDLNLKNYEDPDRSNRIEGSNHESIT